MRKGDIISSYKIDKQIGQGGNSKVYLANSESSCEQVAIKVLEKNKNLDRFEREINFLKHHNHSCITEYIEDGKNDEGIRFHVCQFYQDNLSDVINDDVGWETLFEFSLQLAEGLMYLHENDIYHRDLKPENIYLNNLGKLVIGDFGLINDEVDNLTKERDRIANAFYAAPEQLIKGNANNLDSKVDIYAFGKLINQFFTKKNLSGTGFAKIEDSYPFLYELDILVEKMISYDSSKRPTIKSVYYELNRIKYDLKINEEDTQVYLQINEELSISTEEYLDISQDLYYSQMVYATYKLDDYEEFDCNWHLKYSYSVTENLWNLCFNELAYKIVKNKFLYEGNVGIDHPLLDVKEKLENKEVYQEFCKLLDEYSLGREYQWFVNRIKRYFNSCCNYHAKEIIKELKRQWKDEQLNIFNAPILWMLRALKKIIEVNQKVFSEKLIDNIQLDKIEINHEGDYNPPRNDSGTRNILDKNIKFLIELEKKGYIEGYDIKDNYTLFLTKLQFEHLKRECYNSNLAEKHSGEIYSSDKSLVLIEDIDNIFNCKKEYEKFTSIEITSYEILKIKQLLTLVV